MAVMILGIAVIALAVVGVLLGIAGKNQNKRLSELERESLARSSYCPYYQIADYSGLLETKADRHVYVKVGEAWAVLEDKDKVTTITDSSGTRYVDDSRFTLGKHANAYEFIGEEVHIAVRLAKKWNGELVEASHEPE